MALIVETGAIVAGANSYIDVAFADAYLAITGNASVWAAATTEQKETALQYATRLIDQSFRFEGTKLGGLAWPRSRCWDLVEGSYVPANGIPDALKSATAEMALVCVSGNPEAASVGGVDASIISGVSVPDLSVTVSGVPSSSPLSSKAINLLRRFGWAPGGPGLVPVRRT